MSKWLIGLVLVAAFLHGVHASGMQPGFVFLFVIAFVLFRLFVCAPFVGGPKKKAFVLGPRTTFGELLDPRIF
jgi:hypothetical protein